MDTLDKFFPKTVDIFGIPVPSESIVAIIVAVLILIATAIIAKILAGACRRLMQAKDNLPNTTIFVNVVRVLVWVVGISLILDLCFNVKLSSMVAALGIGGIAISLGCQDSLANIIGGLQISAMRVVEPGDNIRIGDQYGVVKDVNWRHTRIVNRAGEVAIIPNALMNKEELVFLHNTTHVIVDFYITSTDRDLDADAQQIVELCAEATAPITKIIDEPYVLFTKGTEFGFKGKVQFTIEDAEKLNNVIDACVRAIAPVCIPPAK